MYEDGIIGKRMRVAMKARHMTQEQLAEKTGLTVTTISRYARGLRIPKGPCVLTLANALGVTWGYLMGMEDSHENKTW